MKFFTVTSFIEKINQLKQNHQNNYNHNMVKFQEESIGELKNKEPDLSENSLNKKLTQVSYVKSVFDKTLNNVTENSPNKENKIHDLWIEVVKTTQFRSYFDFEYIYNMLVNYQDYCKYLDSEVYEPLVIAIILQRIGGKSKNFSENADFAKSFLYEKIGTPLIFAEQVKQFILSTIYLEIPDSDIKKTTFRDLQFIRLAADYDIFLDNQTKFYSERMRFPLTRIEFFKCQLLIYKKIEKMSGIFVLYFFKSKYETPARENIKKYIQYLEVKIKDLEKEEEEEALISGYCS